jgi:hypothetical protein
MELSVTTLEQWMGSRHTCKTQKQWGGGGTYFNYKRIMWVVLVLVDTIYDLLIMGCIGKF